MADPLGVAASVITVAGLATSSCQQLYKALHRFSEAPKDLQGHLATLKALHSTFAIIQGLEQRSLPPEMLSPEFRKRLRECLLDLQAMENLTQSFDSQMGQGRRRRALACVRLSLGDKRQMLKNHLNRLQSYHQSFSLDLLLLNMYENLSPLEDVITDITKVS